MNTVKKQPDENKAYDINLSNEIKRSGETCTAVISIDDDSAGADLASMVPVDRIRAVRMWILARTGREDRAFADTITYVVADQRVNANDGSRHHLLITTVKCRNMAL